MNNYCVLTVGRYTKTVLVIYGADICKTYSLENIIAIYISPSHQIKTFN